MRCFFAITIIKQFINEFISYLFSIVITTSTSFFVLMLFSFDLFAMLIKILITFWKNLFLILIRFFSRTLNNFLFLTLIRFKSSFCDLYFFFKLNEKVLKSLHFCINNVRLIMYNIINKHIANAMLMFDLF